MSSSNCCFLTCIQVSQEAGQVVWYSHLFQNFPQFIVIRTFKGFGIVNKAEIDVFLELSCFFHDPVDVGNLISGSSAFSKTSLNIWKFTVHILLKPGLENFECYFTSVWDECNCVVVWAFFGIAFLWDWNENWPFPVQSICKYYFVKRKKKKVLFCAPLFFQLKSFSFKHFQYWHRLHKFTLDSISGLYRSMIIYLRVGLCKPVPDCHSHLLGLGCCPFHFFLYLAL